jgi:hypothetical protein
MNFKRGRVPVAIALMVLGATGYALAATDSPSQPYAPRVGCGGTGGGMLAIRGRVPAGVSEVYLSHASGASVDGNVSRQTYEFLVPGRGGAQGLPMRLEYVDAAGRRHDSNLATASVPDCSRRVVHRATSARLPGPKPPVFGISPDLQAGEISWCVWNGSSCDYGTAALGSPAFGYDVSNGIVLTAPQVAAVRIGNGPIAPTHGDPQLPYGFRLASPKPTRVRFRLGNHIVSGYPSEAVTALDSAGRVIPSDHAPGDIPPQEQTRSWLFPSRPALGSCSLAVKNSTQLEMGSGSVVTSVVADPGIIGHAFLPCINADLYSLQTTATGPQNAYRSTLEAAVLLDAESPGSTPAMLPDMRPVLGRPGVYDQPSALLNLSPPSSGLSAERAGNAWLVVAGGTGTQQRLRVLANLTVGAINLAPSSTPPSGPVGALCQITSRSLAGLEEVSQEAITRPYDTRGALQVQGRRLLRVASDHLRRDDAQHPNDRQLITRDQAALALNQSALMQRIQSGNPFPPWCDDASFYYNEWPMEAQLILSSKSCPGPRIPVPCAYLKPPWRRTLASVLKPVPGHHNMWTIPPDAYNPAPTTFEQIGKAWLVLSGGTGPQQQEDVLTHLVASLTPALAKRLTHNVTTPTTYCAHLDPTAC